MFFAKKLRFVHYWFQVKKKPNTNKNFVWKSINPTTSLNNEKTDHLHIMAAQSFKFNLKKPRIRTISDNKIKTTPVISNVLLEQKFVLNELKNPNQTPGGTVVCVPKPWYTYWLLPCLGFTALLPSFLPPNVIGQRYGFRFGQIANTKTVDPLSFLENTQVKLAGTIPLVNQTSKPTGETFFRKNHYHITQFLWTSNPETNLYLANHEGITANLQMQSVSQLSETAPLRVVKYHNFGILPDATLFSSPKNTVNRVIPSVNYKQIAQILDLNIKQLLYIKDQSWLEALVHQVKKSPSASVLSFSNISPTIFSLVANNTETVTSIDLQNTNRPQKRFLSAAEDSFYFYQYLSNLPTKTVVNSEHRRFLQIRTQPDSLVQNQAKPAESSSVVETQRNFLPLIAKKYFVLKTPLLQSFSPSSYQTEISSSPDSQSKIVSTSRHSHKNNVNSTQKDPRLIQNYAQQLDSQSIQLKILPNFYKTTTTENQSKFLGSIQNYFRIRNDKQNNREPSVGEHTMSTSDNRDHSGGSFHIQKYLQFLYTKLIRTLSILNYGQIHYSPISINAGFQQMKPSTRKALFVGKTVTGDSKKSSFPSAKHSLRSSLRLQTLPLQVQSYRLSNRVKSEEKLIRNIILSPFKTKRLDAVLNSRFSATKVQKLMNNQLINLARLNTKQVQRGLQKLSYPNVTFAASAPKVTENHGLTNLTNSVLISQGSISPNLENMGPQPANSSLVYKESMPSIDTFRLGKADFGSPLKQPLDLLRIKHFVYLSNTEKQQLKYFKSLDVVLKDEKLLYETLHRQNQQQKRRKKKRKRWTRRRRKRKRKLLRPIWTTLRLSDFLYSKRFKTKSHSKKLKNEGIDALPRYVPTREGVFVNSYRITASSTRPIDVYSYKKTYTLSKKALVELTTKKAIKQKLKLLLKRLEVLHTKNTKNWLQTQVSTVVKQYNEKSTSVNPYLSLEYNRIMYERLQALLLTYANQSEKTLNSDLTGSIVSLAHTNSSKVNSLHTKIIHNVPKEEWLWLFKYMTGELPAHAHLSTVDELRSLWAMNKLNTVNQWTGWKNFYYQEFKKGLTPVYELWQDKKPDKRYNVNSLKKRQYKHLKQVQRLRIFPQLHKGTYFALQRDIQKLRVLGIGGPTLKEYSFASQDTSLYRPSLHSSKESQRSTTRSIETLRSKLQHLKLWSMRTNFNTVTMANSIAQTNQFDLSTINSESSSTTNEIFSANTLAKPILDLYANWWESTNGMGWGWKTIQYGAPWDRKTLYVPTKLTRTKALIYSGIEKYSYTSIKQRQPELARLIGQYNNANLLSTSLILSTFILHICACLALFSLAEFRYSLKVQLILGYKLSSIPLKIISTLSTPFMSHNNSKSSSTKISSTADFYFPNSLLSTLVYSPEWTKVNKSKNIDFSPNRFLPLLFQTTRVPHLNHSRDSSPQDVKLERYTSSTRAKLRCYGILQQLVKKSLRKYESSLVLPRKAFDEEQYYGTSSEEILNLNSRSNKAHNSKVSSYLSNLTVIEIKKNSLQTSVALSRVNHGALKLGYSIYMNLLLSFEKLIDCFRESTRSIYDFFSLPENFSANPDEMGLDVIANFIYDFEEPLIELVPDIVETKSEVYLNRLLVTLNLFGPVTFLAQQRLKWFYRMFVELIYQSDADYRKDEEELHILYTIWAEVLNKAAQELDLEASVIASQEDQRLLLLEYLVMSNLLDRTSFTPNGVNFEDLSLKGLMAKERREHLTIPSLMRHFFAQENGLSQDQSPKDPHASVLASPIQPKSSILNTIRFSPKVARSNNEISVRSGKVPMNNWLVDQYLLYKTDETDLFLEINMPKSFSEIPYIKYWDTLQQPIGYATCQLFSGIMTKQMAKNILLIADQTAEKTQILQALAGETEVKLILDNSGRYASISQSVAVGMRLLRDVFEAVALQTPCIFVLEDIHLIGEKRPFLISDEDLALVTNSGLGLEQHQLYEKIQKIQQHSKHRISYYKKAYRGDAADSLPTNLFCYDLFANALTTSNSHTPTYPLPVDFHQDLLDISTATNLSGSPETGLSILKSPPTSHLLLSEKSFSNDTSGAKVSHFVTETLWSTKAEESQQKNNTVLSLRGKVASLAELALGNISVKLDRITQLLVIMDNVRKNKGFIVFGTTNKPQLLDPALRRPGRLEETIYLPSIPNILTKWEILNSQMQYSHYSSLGQTPGSVVTVYSSVGSSSTLPVTIDVFNLFIRGQGSNLTSKMKDSHNWGLKLAQSSSRMGYQTHSLTQLSTPAARLMSILKATFVTQLFVQTKMKKIVDYKKTNMTRGQKRLLTSYPISSPQCSPNVRSEHYMTDSVAKSYDLTGKYLLEFMTKQQSTCLFLANSISPSDSGDEGLYTRLLSPKLLFKNELIGIFAGIVASYFSNLVLAKQSPLIKASNIYDCIMERHQTLPGSPALDNTIHHNWQVATRLIYSYIQKRSIYKKNAYVQKLVNQNYGSLRNFSSPPTTSLLLPAKRFENYLRAERDFNHTTQSKIAISSQEKIDLHLHQRVLKRLYKLPIKEFYKSEIIEKSLTTFASATLVLPPTTRNLVKQNTQAKTNYYYRNIFLNRHRHYLTTQWWTGHLTEYNIENTIMSEIDFRSIFINKTKTNDFTGDLIIDFPDADQHYNIKQRRWFIQSTTWKGWYDIDSGLTTDIINHYVVEIFTLTYSILNANREILDHLVLKLLLNYQLQESELLTDLSVFTMSERNASR